MHSAEQTQCLLCKPLVRDPAASTTGFVKTRSIDGISPDPCSPPSFCRAAVERLRDAARSSLARSVDVATGSAKPCARVSTCRCLSDLKTSAASWQAWRCIGRFRVLGIGPCRRDFENSRKTYIWNAHRLTRGFAPATYQSAALFCKLKFYSNIDNDITANLRLAGQDVPISLVLLCERILHSHAHIAR